MQEEQILRLSMGALAIILLCLLAILSKFGRCKEKTGQNFLLLFSSTCSFVFWFLLHTNIYLFRLVSVFVPPFLFVHFYLVSFLSFLFLIV